MRIANLNKSIVGLFFLSPFIATYLLLFWLSNEVAPDRDVYIHQIMTHPFSGREEPSLHIISFVIGFVCKNPATKLFLVQVCFIVLLALVLSKMFNVSRLDGLAKLFLSFVFILTIFSNQLGVQLRIGYASIFFVFLFFFLNLRPTFKNIVFYSIPCLLHMALIPAVVVLYVFYFFNIKNTARLSFLLLIGLIAGYFAIINMEYVFNLIGLPDYYFGYLIGGELSEGGRRIPFSMIFYVILILVMMLILGKRNYDPAYRFCFIGLIFAFMGFMGFYIAFKFLIPVILFSLIYFFSRIRFESYSALFFALLAICISPIGFYYYVLQVNL